MVYKLYGSEKPEVILIQLSARHENATIESEVAKIVEELRGVLVRPGAEKADVVAALGEYLPDFRHIEKGKGLDSRM